MPAGFGKRSGETEQSKGCHRAPGRLHRPPLEVIVAFVDENREQFGVEFICTLMQMAPSSYYAAKKRQTCPSARALRDVILMQVLLTLWVANRKVYGAHKLWRTAQRAGHDIGRDQVAGCVNSTWPQGDGADSSDRRNTMTGFADATRLSGRWSGPGLRLAC